MKNKCKRIMIGTIVLLSFFLSATLFAVAEPVLESFTIDPEEPAPLSDITVTADIGGEGITAVVVHIKECNDRPEYPKVCFSEQEITMSEVETGKYTASLTLQEEKANYIQYYFDITVDGEVVRLLEDTWKNYLKIDSSNGQSNGDGDNGTPGFEFIVLITAIGMGFVLFRKKRL